MLIFLRLFSPKEQDENLSDNNTYDVYDHHLLCASLETSLKNLLSKGLASLPV